MRVLATLDRILRDGLLELPFELIYEKKVSFMENWERAMQLEERARGEELGMLIGRGQKPE